MEQEQINKLKTGTTTVGVLAKDGVVLAADMKATLGNIASDLNTTKIYQINRNNAITLAGGVGDCLMIIRYLKSHAKLFEIERERPMTPKAMITYLSNILNSNRYYPFASFFILGGYNDKPELYTTDMVGGYNEVDKFTSTGSGFELAYGYLEENYKEIQTIDKAVLAAINAVKVAKRRDVFSGGDGIKVFKITKEGAKELSPQEIAKHQQ